MQVLKSGSRKFDTSDNWSVLSPDDIHMFTTSKRRADFYLNKNIAIIVGDKKIKLTFTPRGLGFNEHEIFGLTPRLNHCVVCKVTENLQRHHVVPYHYRKFMPIDYKSRNHHDVVLICRKHHEQYEEIAKEYKNYIANKYGVKTIEQLNTEYVIKVVDRLRLKFKISKLLRTIIENYNNIPINKIEVIGNELTELLRFNVLNTTFEDLNKILRKLDKAIKREKRDVLNVDDFYHGKIVINLFKSHNDFEIFIKGWRQHFIDSMKPQYMPLGWSIDFRCKR